MKKRTRAPLIKVDRAQIAKYLTGRNVLIALLCFVALMFLGRYVIALALTALFIPMGIFSTRVSKFVPHVSIETITMSSIFMGYIFGSKVGILFAIVVGGYVYTKNSMLALTYIAVIFFAAIMAAVAAYLASIGMGFFYAGMLCALLRNIIALPAYMFVISPNPMENVIHHTTHTFLNALVYVPVFNVLLGLVNIIG